MPIHSAQIDTPPIMARDWWLTLENMAMGRPVLGTSELVLRGYAVFDSEHGYWHATRTGLVALGAWLAAEPHA